MPTAGSMSETGCAAETNLRLALPLSDIPIKLPDDPGWVELAAPYNTRLPFTPAVIVIPKTEDHVRHAVLCAARLGLQVQARSGGHSYASFSIGGRDGAMVIDLRHFQGVSVDQQGIAKVGAGARLGSVAVALLARGRALAHGTCPAVGVGGHATHGGFGMTSRAWGLLLDHIVAMDVVLADGRCVRTSETEHCDLYFALRGAADSFGIVTDFYFRTHPVPTRVVHVDLHFDRLLSNVANAVLVFQHFQRFTQDPNSIDRRLTLSIRFNGGLGLSLTAVYLGTRWQLEDEILPKLLGGLPIAPSSTSIQEVSWLRSLVILSGNNNLDAGSVGPPRQDNFFTKSVTTDTTISAEALECYFQYAKDKGPSAPTSWDAMINLYGGCDSQISAPEAGSSAHSERITMWVAQHYAYVAVDEEFPQEGLEFVEGLNEAMTRHMPRFGACVSYVDPSLSRGQAHELYYGKDVYEKLKSIKRAVDPGNMFANPQSIQPGRGDLQGTREKENSGGSVAIGAPSLGW